MYVKHFYDINLYKYLCVMCLNIKNDLKAHFLPFFKIKQRI